jgi:large subunit ribosomal protein L24e
MKRNPRKIRWTAIYRRLHKKGQVDVVSRRRNKRAAKTTRGVGTMSLEQIEQKRSQTSAVRQSQRDAALREIKERKSKGGKGTGGAQKKRR